MQANIDKLIEKNKKLVYKQLHSFKLINDPDAESLAFEALYKAVRDYDETKGNALSTVATVYIYNALGNYLRTLKKKRQLEVISYNGIAYTDDGEEHEFLDFMESSSDVEKDTIRQEVIINVRRVVDEAFNKLTNDKHILIIRYWKNSDYTMTTVEISELVGVSQSYVSQVIKNFKASLKKQLEEFYYD